MMPIPAHTIRCQQCGWSRIFPATSDVLLPHQVPPSHCPRCGSDELQQQDSRLIQRVRQWLGSGQ